MNTAKDILRKLRDEIPYFLPTKADPYIIESMELHTDLATKTLQEENRQLLEWKRQQLEVWGPVDDWGQKNVELGKSIQSEVLKTLEDYQQLKERADKMVLTLIKCKSWIQGDRLHNNPGIQMGAAKLMDEITEALTAYQTNKNEG